LAPTGGRGSGRTARRQERGRNGRARRQSARLGSVDLDAKLAEPDAQVTEGRRERRRSRRRKSRVGAGGARAAQAGGAEVDVVHQREGRDAGWAPPIPQRAQRGEKGEAEENRPKGVALLHSPGRGYHRHTAAVRQRHQERRRGPTVESRQVGEGLA
jgi:hypothetical protein